MLALQTSLWIFSKIQNRFIIIYKFIFGTTWGKIFQKLITFILKPKWSLNTLVLYAFSINSHDTQIFNCKGLTLIILKVKHRKTFFTSHLILILLTVRYFFGNRKTCIGFFNKNTSFNALLTIIINKLVVHLTIFNLIISLYTFGYLI